MFFKNPFEKIFFLTSLLTALTFIEVSLETGETQLRFLNFDEEENFINKSCCKGRQSALGGPSLNILQGNDDGWAEANIRALYQVLRGLGHNSIISSPTENKSGTGPSSKDWEPLAEEGQYGSIPKGAPGTSSVLNDDHIWYVNAYPVDGIRYGLDSLAPRFFGGFPNLVVTGPNVGENVGLMVHFSGTFNAASYATKFGIPSISISVAEKNRHSYEDLTPTDPSFIYSNTTIRLINALTMDQAKDDDYLSENLILPLNCTLNVNLQEAGPQKNCKKPEDYKFVLTSLYGLDFNSDLDYCGSNRLKSEIEILNRDEGCWATITIVNAKDKLTFNSKNKKTDYNFLFKRLKSFLSCP